MADGSLVTWGTNGFLEQGAPSLPAGTSRVVDAAAGETYCAMLFSDGAIDVFGSDGVVESVTPPPAPSGMRYESIDAGDYHMAALRSDGMVIASGDNSVGQCDIPRSPPGTRYIDFSVSGGNTLLVRSDGVALGVGDNTYGQLAIPALPSGVRYTSVSNYYSAIVFLRSDGTVVSNPGAFPGPVPSLPPGLRYVQVAAGPFFALLLRSDGVVVPWGTFGGNYTFPSLPVGMYYVEVTGGSTTGVGAVRRSDGEVFLVGAVYPWLVETPPLEPGTSYVGIDSCGDADVITRIGPTSTYIGYAPGCAGTLPPARLVPRDTPRIGATLQVTLFDLPQDAAIMVFGWNRTAPTSLASFGMPSCASHVSLDASYLLSGQNQQAVSLLLVPNDANLVGLRFTNQAIVLDVPANPAGAVVSDAAEAVIGHW